MPRKKNNRKKIQTAKRAAARAEEVRNRPRGWQAHQDTIRFVRPTNAGLSAGIMMAAQMALASQIVVGMKGQDDE